MQFGVSECVSHWGKYGKDKIAIHSNNELVSYSQLNFLVNNICKTIDEKAPHSKRISIAIKSKVDLISAIIATIRTGRSAVLINVNLPHDSLTTNIKDTATDCLICDDYYKEIIELFSIHQINTIKFTEIEQDKLNNHYVSFNSKPEDEWGILFSSGTTGTPKGIERNHESIVTELIGWCLELELRKDTTFYIGRPIYYTGGLVLALSTLISGGSIVINDYKNDNDFEEIWLDHIKTLNNISIEWAFFIPDQVRKFCSIIEDKSIPLEVYSKNILVMGAPINGKEKVFANKLLCSNIIESWGNTESLGTITETNDLINRPESIGRPFISDELYILDDDLNELPPYAFGQIAGNEEAGFTMYSNRQDETDRIKQKNLIVSDDIGYMDSEGYLYVKGRVQDRLILGDKTVFTAEIEQRINEIDLVESCCIVFKGTTSFEGMCVAITTNDSAAQEIIYESINSVLYEMGISCKNIVVLSELPRLTSGKTDKIKLQEYFNE
jgi:acyl-coenzyme A synthetase/AMP-(fatty) acid ligase